MSNGEVDRYVLAPCKTWEENIGRSAIRPVDGLFPAVWNARLLQNPANKVANAEVSVKEGWARAHDRVVAEGVDGAPARRATSPGIVGRDNGVAHVPFE